MRRLPYIHDQDGNTCYADSIAAVMEWHLREKGVNVELDVNEFNERLIASKPWYFSGNHTNVMQGLNFAESDGFKGDNGEIYKIKGWTNLTTRWIDTIKHTYLYNVLKEEPVIATFDCETSDDWTEKVNSDGVLMLRAKAVSHGIVICDYSRRIPGFEEYGPSFWCANSYGKDFGIDGYFVFPLRQTVVNRNKKLKNYIKINI